MLKQGRIRTYFLRASLDELHQNSRMWLSELAFWKDEFRFMKNLLIMNFVHFLEKEKQDSINQLADKLLDLSEIELAKLEKRILTHEKHLAEILDDPTSHHESVFRREHARLDTEMAQLKTEVKIVKHELFHIGEEILKDDHPLRLSRIPEG